MKSVKRAAQHKINLAMQNLEETVILQFATGNK